MTAAVDMRVDHAVRPARVGLLVAAGTRPVPQLRLSLLGGFRAERVGGDWPISGWQRRSAKTLAKLLATCPGHTLHREQLLDILWPGVELESALNSFGKALYAARRALEPDLAPRENSSYLRLTDSMVALETDHVWIDADHFEQLAESALRDGDAGAYESALVAYGGDLLPEDRYEDWCAQRRDYLAELHIRLLLGLADELEGRGAHGAAAARLREVLQHDPTREDVHRRLMSLYVSAGIRDHAVRQFHVCEEALKRELDLAPAEATQSLYKQILAQPVELDVPPSVPDDRRGAERAAATPFVGREPLLCRLREQLSRAEAGTGRMVLVMGEAGVGKSRLVEEFTAEAQQRGCCVLSGGTGAHTNHLAYGPFAVALEGYVAGQSEAERQALAQRYPALAQFVPSLGLGKSILGAAEQPADDQLYLVPSIVRLLTDLARTQPVVLVLGDLHGLHRSSLNLLGYLAPLAAQRRWLIVGTYREEGLEPRGELRRMIDAAERERLCLRFELERLSRTDCDRLVRALLPGGSVDDPVLEHVYARSLGNPLFVEELLPEMQERSELVLANGSWGRAPSPSARVPTSLRALVALRMAPLKESARRVLGLVSATSEMEISLTDLRAGAAALRPPVSDVALFDALDRALELHILEERNGSYAFRHPLVRSALYEDLSMHRRDELHAALGRSLATSP
ncbi:MAG TPA: AAA family ATPase [Thermoleophilaceae bacterium]|nr:AAA family ATPase [Thermoleophilaceae bacterium]